MRRLIVALSIVKAGFFDALKNVQFVMKDGQVFRRDGMMTPAAFFHGGPVNGWRIR